MCCKSDNVHFVNLSRSYYYGDSTFFDDSCVQTLYTLLLSVLKTNSSIP